MEQGRQSNNLILGLKKGEDSLPWLDKGQICFFKNVTVGKQTYH